jgi:hypothetical protein
MLESHISRSCRISCRVASILLFSLSFAFGADNVGLSKTALSKIYPELRGHDFHVGISDGGLLDSPGSFTTFTMEVRRPPHETGRDEECPSSLLSVRFEFPIKRTDHRIFSLNAVGPVVNTDRRQRVIQLVDSHPQWSDSEAVKALSEAGARFGPSAKAQVLEKLPVEGLRSLLGAIEVVSAEFTVRDQLQKGENLPSAMLVWSVVVSSRMDSSPKTKYFLLLDPFDAKLVSVGKIPPLP